MQAKVAITIAHWNNWPLLQRCLAALTAQTHTNWVVYLVDNGSSDDSVKQIRANYPQIHLLQETTNTGFAAAHNRAIKAALYDDPHLPFILPLNNDCVLRPEFLSAVLAAADTHPTAGSIQGKLFRDDQSNQIDATGVELYYDLIAVNRGQGQTDTGQYAAIEEIWGASASAALYRVAALTATRLPNGDYFDRDYFAYYEDVDLAWRLRLAGWSCWYTPQAVATHVHSATGKSHSPFKAFHIHRNHLYNMIKNLPLGRLLIGFAWLPVRYGLLLSSVLRGHGAAAALKTNLDQAAKGPGMAGLVLRSWADVARQLPRLLQKRRSIQRSRCVSAHEIRRWFRHYRTTLKTIYFRTS